MLTLNLVGAEHLRSVLTFGRRDRAGAGARSIADLNRFAFRETQKVVRARPTDPAHAIRKNPRITPIFVMIRIPERDVVRIIPAADLHRAVEGNAPVNAIGRIEGGEAAAGD